MANLRESALIYESKKTKNISDLPKVSTQLDLQKQTGIDKEGKEFTYYFVEVEGEKYRVPVSVLEGLKTQLEEDPELEFFRAKKTGSTMKDTKYVVVPVRK